MDAAVGRKSSRGDAAVLYVLQETWREDSSHQPAGNVCFDGRSDSEAATTSSARLINNKDAHEHFQDTFPGHFNILAELMSQCLEMEEMT